MKNLTPIADYVTQKEMTSQLLTKITGGKMYVLYYGHWVLFSKFKAEFPTPSRLFSSKENPCKKVAILI